MTTNKYKHQKTYYHSHKDNILKAMKKKHVDALRDGTYECKIHDMVFRDQARLNKHMNIKAHNPDRKVKYECIICDFETVIKSHLGRHQRTIKHRRNSSSDDE